MYTDESAQRAMRERQREIERLSGRRQVYSVRSNEDDGWRQVQRRRRQGEKACMSFGNIVDAFVARKKDRFGGNFGFVRYIKVSNLEDIMYKINCINNNNGPLKANVARFSRDGQKKNSMSTSKAYIHAKDDDERRIRPTYRHVRGFGSSGSTTQGNLSRSFKDVVTGVLSKVVDNAKAVKEKMNINIPSGLDFSTFEWLGNCLIGELKDVDLLAKCFSIFHSNGIGECSVIYLGGLSVLLRFENSRVASAFLEEHRDNWSFWFEGLRKWSDIKKFDNNNMEDSDMESEEWLYENGNNNCDSSSFVEDTGNESELEKEIIGNQLSSNERCLDMVLRESKAEGSMEKAGSNRGEHEPTKRDKSNVSNEDSLKSVEETNFEAVNGDHVQEDTGGIFGKIYNEFEAVNGDHVQEDTGGIFGNIFNEFGSQEEEGQRELSSRAKSDGFISPHDIPDLNNPLPLSDPISRPRSYNKNTGRRAFSVKFKDIINAANQGKKNSKINKQAMNNEEKSDHGGNSRQASEQSSSSCEIRKTIQVGNSIGYRLEGAEKVVEAILKGEGVQVKSK
ncbi:hypothetical protein L2E82_30819 [Cichorium intybus]|uniref:Uncharacterized protein n=1 Tax=Cichorium intybus TaxID=13427 RepID=A0ACB9D1S2_CICIN|nr:hypothetical protein L2E82_30819 [Cichorium intybus]